MNYDIKRRSIRFNADPEDYALILTGTDKQVLKKPILALLIEESKNGCHIVLAKTIAPELGHHIQVKIGEQAPIWAEVRWTKTLSEKVTSVGLQYDETEKVKK